MLTLEPYYLNNGTIILRTGFRFLLLEKPAVFSVGAYFLRFVSFLQTLAVYVLRVFWIYTTSPRKRVSSFPYHLPLSPNGF